jgi:energy-coupling factor transporter ATP-binding protein EcfA2
MDSISVVRLGDRELEKHLEEATRKLLSFPAPAPPREAQGTATLGGRRFAYRPLQSAYDTRAEPRSELDLAARVQAIAPRDELYTDVEHRVLRLLRRAVQVYAAVYEAVEQASGLDRLKEANRSGALASRLEPELRAKVETACGAALFAFSAYALTRLLEEESRQGPEAPVFELAPPGELPLGGRSEALHAGLHHVYRAVDDHARDDASLVHAVREAVGGLAERVRALRGSLQHAEFYTRYHFRIEPEDVLIAGFELPHARQRSQIAVPEKRPAQVVGNHVAKLEGARIAQRLACYDPERQRNPFVDLGGFVFTFIGDGRPGTGKTTLIQMIATLLRDYGGVAGLPLRYENFSVDQISDYQGRSGQNAKQFCQGILDPRSVGFGSVDDVDQVCGRRGDRNASAGQLEVTAVFMQELAGPATVIRGNASFGFFSNHPDRVDEALRQRAQARFRIDGPQTADDFADLLHVFLSRSLEIPPGPGWEPGAAQRVREVIREKYAEHSLPRSPELRRVFEEIVARYGDERRLSSWRAFGEYLHALQERDPRLTGRAVRNIADAVHARMMDFDLPAEWLERRETFFAQSYETRVSMLAELRGEVTPEIALQEIHRYVESEARYGAVADQRELEERTRQILLEARARKAAAEHERS